MMADIRNGGVKSERKEVFRFNYFGASFFQYADARALVGALTFPHSRINDLSDVF